MKKILVLGAGLVSKPLVNYLMAQPDFQVIVASRTVSKAKALVGDSPSGKALPIDVQNDAELEELVKSADLTVSLLPYTYHVKVAKMCIKHKRHLVTTSYVSKEMASLNQDAESAGVLLLNEIGLDPGIDHMSAMDVINRVHGGGGHVVSFVSLCGGLPAPEANDNPFGYKFSWSPRGVLMAGKNNARFLEGGEMKEIMGRDLFDNYWSEEVPGLGLLEAYPNRDSMPYIATYGISETHTMLRGTFRNIGWCSIIKKFSELGMLDDTMDKKYAGMTYRQFMANIAGKPRARLVKKAVAEKLGIDEDSPEINAMDWLGLFEDVAIPENTPLNPMDILGALMQEKMAYNPGERDMILLRHVFEIYHPHTGRKDRVTATLIDFGIPNGDSSMARTVSLPAAVAVKMILNGRINRTGVMIPVEPDIYVPVMEELNGMGIRFEEKWENLEMGHKAGVL